MVMSNALTYLAIIGPSGGELLIVMLALLLLFGSKDAPRIMRKLTDMINKVRNTAETFKREVMFGDFDPEDHTELFGPQRQYKPTEPGVQSTEEESVTELEADSIDEGSGCGGDITVNRGSDVPEA